MDLARAAALTDERMAAFRAEVDAPAVAYGLVKDGVLVHAVGRRRRSTTAARPDPTTCSASRR